MGIFSEKLRPEQDLSNDVDSVFNDYMFKDVEFKDMQGNTHTGTVSAVHFATDEYDDDYLVIYSDEGKEVLKRPKDVKLIETLEECFNDTLIGPQKQNEELFEGFNYSDGPDDEDVGTFIEIASKSVEDSDGFLTDYTMYRDTETGEYVFVLGDKDAYSPEDGNFDWSCDTEKEAWDWFNSYYTGLDVDGDELLEGVSDPDFAKSSAVKDNSADSDEDEKLQESPHAIGNATDIDEDEVVLSNYLGYTLTETNVYYEGKDIDEVYYIVIAPDGNVMTEDFYAWAEVEGLDFENLSTSDKVARFADYVDSIKK